MLVRIQARSRDGRWRAGKFWPHQWVEAEVTDAQLALLQGDRLLVVHLAATRNKAVPTVNEMQPQVNRNAKPQPWGDPQLERLRREAVALDAKKAEVAEEAKAARVAEANAEANGDERRGTPVEDVVRQQHGGNKHQQHRR